ncbi:MAG: HAMP domain-containing histidine kinase [Clostridiales bacterium]|nr:HAMP domain-containing histidine kinase [Clostridiales bacterium]
MYSNAKAGAASLVFIAFDGNTNAPFGMAGEASPIIATLVLTIATVVAAIILISLFLANKMVKKITGPLDSLCEGAGRVAEGNLDEDIHCRDAAELEKVCVSFNEMQRQLRENIKKNNMYEQDRKEMLAGISHDLRTPLTSIKSYVKGLQDGVAQTPEKQREYLEIIDRKASDLESLLDRLFLFSKLETGNMPFHFRSIPIQKYIVTLLDSLESDLKKKGATLTVGGNCSHLKARLDSEQMTRAIANILDNSVKYNTGRQINITVTLREQDGKIMLRLQDNGVGVSNQQLSRLFDSFYRGDVSRNNSSDGSGLGLAIARNIVDAHGGRITAESYNGLTILIELPIETEDEL